MIPAVIRLRENQLLPNYTPQRKSGDERILVDGSVAGPSVLEFWQWAASDLLNNSLRGHFAEFLVLSALEISQGVRVEWDATDVTMPSGVKIEVKSSAYLQAWPQEKESAISFTIRETQAWSSETKTYSPEKTRQSHIYIFCLLEHRDKRTVDPLDMGQWKFYVVRTSDIDKHFSAQKTISLAKLMTIPHRECKYGELKVAAYEIAATIAV